jgi:hypothetical protein
MTFTVELTPEEERRLQTATARGFDARAMFKGLIASLPDAEPSEPAVWTDDLDVVPAESVAAMAQRHEAHRRRRMAAPVETADVDVPVLYDGANW